MRVQYELSQIICDYGADYERSHAVLKQHSRTLHALKICRTSALGGHVERCDNAKCKHERIAYNSCRNRHCPKCQSSNRERWILAREEDLLDVTYFHVVFTVPEEINSFCLKYPKELYNLLFEASKETLFTFGANPKHLGAKMGAISILHTWGQNMSLHPHVHMIVPGGGFINEDTWKDGASNGDFLFCAKAMAKVYRGKFMEKLVLFLKEKKIPMEVSLRRKLYDKNWVVYAKEPFQSPKNVIEYLGRYTHKIAISNHRIKSIKDGKVTFSYKDYRHGSVTKNITLEATEFLRRFCLHILPPRFVKIRHYGFLASRVKRKLKIEQMKRGIIAQKDKSIHSKSDYAEIAKVRLGLDISTCPCCKTGRMVIVMQFGANAPPVKINDQRKQIKTNDK
jgi:hypothetical protein